MTPAPPITEDVAEHFYSRAPVRITRFIFFLAVVAFVPLALRFGWNFALGFATGSALAWLNFHWLTQAVSGLADRIVDSNSRERGRSVVVKFLIRYVLIGLAAYVIFTSWSAALYGLFAGLCLPALAMVCEAGYEAYVAFRRGL